METIYHSGRILTMIDQDDDPEAVLVRDGRIAAVGTLEQVRAAATPRAERVDLAGRTLMPSFIDSHGHILQHGMLASLVDLENARSIDEIVSAFGERLAQREPDDRSPVVGAKYDPQLLAEGRHPTREDLDAVTTDLPVFALHRSLHVAVGNSVLVDGAGLTAATPDPEGGRFGRFPDGTPDGYVEEHPAMAAYVPVLSPGGGSLIPGVTDPLRAAELAVADYLRHGITTAQEGAADPTTVSVLAEAARAGALDLDVVVYPLVQSGTEVLDAHADLAGDYVGRLRLGGYKMILDGSPQARSAWMSEPYEPIEGDDERARVRLPDPHRGRGRRLHPRGRGAGRAADRPLQRRRRGAAVGRHRRTCRSRAPRAARRPPGDDPRPDRAGRPAGADGVPGHGRLDLLLPLLVLG